MRVVLHIGTNKTGTSALQGLLSTGPKPLKDANLIYPISGRRSSDSPAHHALADAMHIAPHRADYFVSELAEETANEQADGVFLSSEVFHTINPIPLIQSFQADGHEVDVICVVRNHTDYFSSWYRETVKSEISTFDFPNFAYLINKPYSPFISLWMNTVGEDNFYLYGYEDHGYRAGNRSYPLFNELTSELSEEENPSIAGNLLLFKRLLNNFITREQSELLIPELREICKLEPRFCGDMYVDEGLCALLDKIYAQDQQQIHEYFGVDIYSRSENRPGSPVPDLDTLRADREFILSICDDRGFLLGDLIRKYTGPM